MATVVRVGTDSSRRPIYMSRKMRRWWRRVCRRLGFKPTVVQGAWMSKVSGGGADDSAGYHDKGGCLDLRTWDLTSAQQERVIRVVRSMGGAIWRRDKTHGGMDSHFHLVFGTDHDLGWGAQAQWADYIAGKDGLASRGPDYHWRPNPLVVVPPPSAHKVRAGLREVIDEASRLGMPVADKLRKIKNRIRKW